MSHRNAPLSAPARMPRSPTDVRSRGPLLLVLLALAWTAPVPPTAHAAPPPEDTWLQSLYDRVAADVRAGRPVVVQAHVPLCDNRIIRCGRYGLGDGDSPRTNLYWATSGGFKGWFGRKKSGWTGVYKGAHAHDDILEVRVWRRRFPATRAWRERGVERSFEVYVVAFAWRGSAILQAMNAYAADLFGQTPRPQELADGTRLEAGGAAHIVSYVGHNGWMDVAQFNWPTSPKSGQLAEETPEKGTIAVACITADYIGRDVSHQKRVPLLMTKTLLFAGAHSFEGAVSAFARARSLSRIRRAAATSYATGQDKTVRRVWSAFTNPSDRRWAGTVGSAD